MLQATKRKLQEINRARQRRKQTQAEKESEHVINIEVIRRKILQVEMTDLKEIIQGLETKEDYYRGLVGRPSLTPYPKAVYSRKFEIASGLRRAFKDR